MRMPPVAGLERKRDDEPHVQPELRRRGIWPLSIFTMSNSVRLAVYEQIENIASPDCRPGAASGHRHQAIDVVIAGVGIAASIAVAGEDVERAVGARDDVAQTAEPGVVKPASEPVLDAGDGKAALVLRQLDPDEAAAQRRHEEIAFAEGEPRRRHRLRRPDEYRIDEAGATWRAHDPRPTIVPAGADHVDLVMGRQA